MKDQTQIELIQQRVLNKIEKQDKFVLKPDLELTRKES